MELVDLIFSTFDSVFAPVLGLGAFPSIVAFSLGLALMFTFFYWLLVDKEDFQKAKQKLKDKQKKAKEAQEEGDDERAAELMKETFAHQKDFFMVSAKPMAATFVFIALFFPWLGATYSPGVELQGEDEIFHGTLEFADEQKEVTVTNTTEQAEIEIDGETLSEGEKFKFAGVSWEITHFGDPTGWFSGEGTELGVRAEFIPLPFELPFVGGAINWLGLYILVTLPVTIVLRKSMGLS